MIGRNDRFKMIIYPLFSKSKILINLKHFQLENIGK